MNTPKYLEDIDGHVIGMPFGEIDVRITRHRSKTTKVTFTKSAEIVPKDNISAFSDIETLLNNLIMVFYSGKVEFAVDIKQGTIQLITIKNKEIKNYGTIQPQGK